MKGQHILRHQAKGINRRVDHLLTAYSYACITFFVLALMLSLLLLFLGFTTTALSLFILTTAITGYVYSVLFQRQQHIKDITDKTIDVLRGRWDELRKDADLLKFFTSSISIDELDAPIKLKVRLYSSTVLDMYAMIIHFINHGYYTHLPKFASIYEEMIKSFFRYPHIIDMWYSKDEWGMGCLKDEYGMPLTDVIDRVIEEIKTEQCK